MGSILEWALTIPRLGWLVCIGMHLIQVSTDILFLALTNSLGRAIIFSLRQIPQPGLVSRNLQGAPAPILDVRRFFVARIREGAELAALWRAVRGGLGARRLPCSR